MVGKNIEKTTGKRGFCDLQVGYADSSVPCRSSLGLDHFLSHDWGTSRFLKVAALLVSFNTATSLNLRIISVYTHIDGNLLREHNNRL